MYTTGAIPRKGRCYCTKCGQIVVLKTNTDELPVCPHCNNTTYRRLS